MNRTNMIQVLGGPKVNPPLTHVLPPDIVGGRQNFDLYPYDPAKAKQLLAAAGYPNGLTLKFLYRNASEGSSKIFQTMQQDLSKVGIKVAGVAVPERRLLHQVPPGAAAAKRGVWDLSLAGWGAGLVRQRRAVVLQPALLRQAVVPADRQQLRASTTTRRPTR